MQKINFTHIGFYIHQIKIFHTTFHIFEFATDKNYIITYFLNVFL